MATRMYLRTAQLEHNPADSTLRFTRSQSRHNEHSRNHLTRELPSIAGCNHCRTPWRNQKRPKRAWPQPLHTRAALHCRLRPLYAKKRSFSCPGILLNTSPMQRARSHYNAFCTATWQTCMYLFIWQQNMTTIIQQFHCDLQPQIPKHFLTTHTRTHPKHLDTTVTLRQ